MGKDEKSKAELLKEQLFVSKESGAKTITDEEIKKADEFCVGYKSFLNNSKTEREAVITSIKIAEKAGFVPFERDKKYKAGDKLYAVNRNKNIFLTVIGKKGAKNGVRLSIAHIDSPRLDLKPNPLYESHDLALFKTHYYGGIKKYQWTALPLALHGVVAFKDGSRKTVCIGEDESEPCFCVSDLLPHLAQKQMEKAAQSFLTVNSSMS